jgi:hypothetical protein
LSTKNRTDLLQWRRDQVIELRGIGLSYAEIAEKLQVSTSLIGTDVQYLREQAKENIKEYVTQRLPEQYQICLAALDTVLKNAFVIMSKSDDNREKLAALELFKDTHLVKLELLSNATTIDHALEYIRSKQREQEKRQKKNNDDTNDSQITADANTNTTGKQSVF